MCTVSSRYISVGVPEDYAHMMCSSKTYQCDDCNYRFDTDEDLFGHLTGHYSHSFARCFYCHEKFLTPLDLAFHMEERHEWFRCVRCYTGFFLRQQFEDHMRTHLPLTLKDLQIYLPGMKDRESFNRFAQRLRPDDDFYDKCETIKWRLERFMQYNTKYRRCRILKGGSVGKETDIKEAADVDLILFLDGYTNMDDFRREIDGILETLQSHIQHGDINWARDTSFTNMTPFCVQFVLSIGPEETKMPIDLLPAMNVLTDKGRQTREFLYARMKKMGDNEKNYYSACLSDLQVDFVKAIPSDLKDVIRVIKHWAKIVKKEEGCNSLKSYFCELVVISTWMEKGSPSHITTASYVRQVIYKMCCCPSIRIVWPGQYDFNKFVPEMDRPMVLDPANPFRNIAPNRKDASVISRRALELVDSSVKKKDAGFRPTYWRPRTSVSVQKESLFESRDESASDSHAPDKRGICDMMYDCLCFGWSMFQWICCALLVLTSMYLINYQRY